MGLEWFSFLYKSVLFRFVMENSCLEGNADASWRDVWTSLSTKWRAIYLINGVDTPFLLQSQFIYSEVFCDIKTKCDLVIICFHFSHTQKKYIYVLTQFFYLTFSQQLTKPLCRLCKHSQSLGWIMVSKSTLCRICYTANEFLFSEFWCPNNWN